MNMGLGLGFSRGSATTPVWLSDYDNPNNLMNAPVAFTGGGPFNTTSVNVNSLYPGENARQLTVTAGTGQSFIWASISGVPTSGTESLTMIVEQFNGSDVGVAAYAPSSGGYLNSAIAYFNLDTESLVSGSGEIENLNATGPNGGALFRLTHRGTYPSPAGGGPRRAYFYGGGAPPTTTGEGHILHHSLYLEE